LLGITTSCKVESSSSSDSSSSPAESNPAGKVALTFTYSSEKEDWIKQVTADFNRQDKRIAGGKSIAVDAIAMGSGDCIDEILNGTRKPHIISPASGAFIKLGNAQSRAKTGKDLIGSTENLVLSPVVIAMWKPMAEALGWGKTPVGWGEILELSKNGAGWGSKGFPQWGPFLFGHTSPETSNSGLIALFAEAYAGAGKVSNLTADDANSEKVARYVSAIEQSVVHYGTSTGFFGKKMFSNGPQYLSAAVLYENMVIDSYDKSKYTMPFPVVAIYPKEGTFWSDHPAGVVEREWVGPEEREAAKVYIDFLLARQQQEKAVALGFRPGSLDVPLTAPVDTLHGVEPKEPKTTLEVPAAEVMNALLKVWSTNKKHADITLVFDTSGSMKEDRRMENARPGALQMVSLLGDEDLFSLLPFSDTPNWAFQNAPLKENRKRVESTVESIYPSGGTALYDSINVAFQEKLSRSQEDRNRISAIVVLTDGADTKSKMSLEELLKEIRSDNETRNIRVFTIGYGSDAQKDVLQQIADATNAKFFEGKPENIRTIFREISTFF